jgi:hypothetical protein
MTASKKIAWLVLGVLLTAEGGAQAQEANGAMFAASDGKGQISLLWFPPATQWPAGGWKLTDSTGQTLAAKIAMADEMALGALSVEDADAIRRLPPVLATNDGSKKRQQLFNIVGLRALTDPTYAKALGIAWTLTGVAAGRRTYTVQGLNAGGSATSVQLTSPAVDASVATPLAPAPDGVQSKSDERGVLLMWAPPAENRQLPAIAYVVERDGGGQTGAAVTARPIVPGVQWDAKIPLLLDTNAPANEMLTYRLYSVDAFGRRSPPATIKMFFPDYHALEPPQPVTATGDAGKVTVNWPAAQKPNLAGYLVERAFLADGPYEALQTQALPPGTAQYEDDTVRGGTTYYYRVRAVNSRGDLGTPSSAAEAQAKNAAAIPKVDGLAADTGETRVRLMWKAVDFPVAGYFVERRVLGAAGNAEQWARLNASVTPEPLYDDALGMTSGVTMEYRVSAVGFDSAMGAPSNAVQVTVADKSIPDPPHDYGVERGGRKSAAEFCACGAGGEDCAIAGAAFRIGDGPGRGDWRSAGGEHARVYRSLCERGRELLLPVGGSGRERESQRSDAAGGDPRWVARDVGSGCADGELHDRSISAFCVAVCHAAFGAERDCGAAGRADGQLDQDRGTDDGYERG